MLTTLNRSTISIHFWNLAEYVGGNLVGDWTDLDACVNYDDFCAKVRKATGDAEELILGDVESEFGITFWEYVGLDTVWKVHELLVEVHESERQAFGDFLAYVGGVDHIEEAAKHFRDVYCGEFNSIEDYAWHFLEEQDESFEVPSGFCLEVDAVAWESDHWISSNGHVFSSY
ncbi:antirestriction protein ArdA [Nonomuraea sp. NPDC050556]|uniref:antirestriction protein ArdA n=1 Tax=Nonomuraea sp. NPDC050556 TaxID=3364369 RepID=UPI0037890405